MKSLQAFVGSLMGLACIRAGAIFLARTRARGVSGCALTVRAVAYQWWWEFDLNRLTTFARELATATNWLASMRPPTFE